MKSVIWFIPAIVVFIGILLLSTVLAVPIKVESVSFMDKIQHAFAYAVLLFSFLYAFKKTKKLTIKTWIILAALAAIYGISLELIQYIFFENRYFEWYDALANVSGILIGSLLFRLTAYVWKV